MCRYIFRRVEETLVLSGKLYSVGRGDGVRYRRGCCVHPPAASLAERIDWRPRLSACCGGCGAGSVAGGSGGGWACPATAAGGAGTACRTGTAAARGSCSG